MSKGTKVIDSAIDVAARTVTMKIAGCSDIVFHASKASDANNAYANLHGWKQRLVDGAALSRDTTTGLPATPAAKHASITEYVTFYEAGGEAWEMKGGGGGVSGERVRLTRALELTKPNDDPAYYRTFVGKLDIKNVRAMLLNPKLSDALAVIDEEATAGVDVDSAFAEIGV